MRLGKHWRNSALGIAKKEHLRLLGSSGSVLLCSDAQWVKGNSLLPEDQSKVREGYFTTAHVLAPSFLHLSQ